MGNLKVFRNCGTCSGTKLMPHPSGGDPTVCTSCSDGTVETGKIDPSNVFQSYEILETFDVSEYGALSEGALTGIAILLSCGRVDLNVGKMGRIALWTYFGAESTTVANLTALLE